MIAKIRGGLTCQYLKFAIIVSFKVREMSLTDRKKATFNERVFQEDVKVNDSGNSRSVFEICPERFHSKLEKCPKK